MLIRSELDAFVQYTSCKFVRKRGPAPSGPSLHTRASYARPMRRVQGRPAKLAKLANWQILQLFAIFWRARSRLYQNEILQENMRLTAFFKLYKICILLHRCSLKIFAKNRFEKSAIFVKFQQKNCKCRQICKILPNFKKFSLRIW